MTNYQELKRLAEAAKLELADIANVVIEDGDLSHHELFQSLASPDVVLGLIKSLGYTTMAAAAEAKEVDERTAVIAVLRTQNQALMEALERMVESVTGVDQVSAVDEARAALTAAQQAQPERAPLTDAEIEQAVKTHGVCWTGYREDKHGFYTIPILSPYHYQFARAIEAAHGIKQGGQHD